MHGRQLLGRIEQSIDVLVRRRWWRLAESQLAPRCDAIAYVPTAASDLSFLDEHRKPFVYHGISFYDVPVLLDYFAQLGVDLAGVWRQDAYEAACDQAVREWLRDAYGPDYYPPKRVEGCLDHVVANLQEIGRGHLVVEARAIFRESASKRALK